MAAVQRWLQAEKQLHQGGQGPLHRDQIPAAARHRDSDPGERAPSAHAHQRARGREGEVDQGGDDHPQADRARGQQVRSFVD